ncbi:MAG: hypothetical protein AB7O80_09335 [Acetobacteraceae bacterium]
MPSELSIQAVQAPSGQTEAYTDPKAAAPAAAAERPVTPAQPFVNPSLRLDAALGLVVIEFRDDAGALTSTIPSQRQIDAYRAHQQALPHQAMPAPAAARAPPSTMGGGDVPAARSDMANPTIATAPAPPSPAPHAATYTGTGTGTTTSAAPPPAAHPRKA